MTRPVSTPRAGGLDGGHDAADVGLGDDPAQVAVRGPRSRRTGRPGQAAWLRSVRRLARTATVTSAGRRRRRRGRQRMRDRLAKVQTPESFADFSGETRLGGRPGKLPPRSSWRKSPACPWRGGPFHVKQAAVDGAPSRSGTRRSHSTCCRRDARRPPRAACGRGTTGRPCATARSARRAIVNTSADGSTRRSQSVEGALGRDAGAAREACGTEALLHEQLVGERLADQLHRAEAQLLERRSRPTLRLHRPLIP